MHITIIAKILHSNKENLPIRSILQIIFCRVVLAPSDLFHFVSEGCSSLFFTLPIGCRNSFSSSSFISAFPYFFNNLNSLCFYFNSPFFGTFFQLFFLKCRRKISDMCEQQHM